MSWRSEEAPPGALSASVGEVKESIFALSMRGCALLLGGDTDGAAGELDVASAEADRVVAWEVDNPPLQDQALALWVPATWQRLPQP